MPDRPRRAAPLAAAAALLLAAGCSAPPAAAPVEPAAVPTEPVADAPPWPAERAAPDLQAAIERAVAGFDGRAGVYVRHLPTGRTAAVDADALFPTASMIKVPILVGTMEAIERGALAWDHPLVFRDSLAYDDTGLFGLLRDGASVPVHRLVEEMLSASDNTSSLWLQGIVGGAEINRWLAREGFARTRVNSRVPGRRADWEAYGWGQTTPREMAELVRRIVDGEAVSPAADHEMHRALTRTFYDDEAVGELPPGVQVASKQGAVSDSRSEVLYVHAPGGPYVLCAITDGQADTSYEPTNAGFELLRAVSRAAWGALEPGRPWAPPPGAARYRLGE